MDDPSVVEALPSLLGITLRRSMVLGRIYLAVGTGYPLIIGLIAASSPSTGLVFPIILPVFGVVGSLGASLVFANDRLKGVFEYLLAYGITARRLFVNALAAALLLATVVVTLSTATWLTAAAVRGYPIAPATLLTLVLYGIPMTYATAAFATAVGMYWTSLTAPREGINNPLGLMPVVGIVPALLTLMAIAIAGPSYFFLVDSIALLLVTAVVGLLLRAMERRMPRERLLSVA